MTSTNSPDTISAVTVSIEMTGRVQGVGFRPFVYSLARELSLTGYIRNRHDSVHIVLQGDPANIERFLLQVITRAPAPASPVIYKVEQAEFCDFPEFLIRPSSSATKPAQTIPLDIACCKQCVQDIFKSDNPRYHYAFTSCCQCGPRYSILRRFPYDRDNTSMQDFTLCQRCEAEYQDPTDRRFHAQTNACPECGPLLQFISEQQVTTNQEDCINECAHAIEAGKIVAVKGIGGFHLVVDACNELAVSRLRELKNRPHKPLAVMYPIRADDLLYFVERDFMLCAVSRELLMSAQRPIVVLERARNNRGYTSGFASSFMLAHSVNPALHECGVFIPYTPLHLLLLNRLESPVVLTSANLPGEPLIHSDSVLQKKLQTGYDALLTHNRDILHAVDDSVYRIIDERAVPMRQGRGTAPCRVTCSSRFKPTKTYLAVGGHNKNTVALNNSKSIIVSEHIGDLTSPAGLRRFEKVVHDLTTLYQIKPNALVCDKHPDYQSSRWARQSTLPIIEVQHHKAHASALWHEQMTWGSCIMFVWDGYGLGDDGRLWGAETFTGEPGRWVRRASFRPLKLVGALKASRQIWRSRLSTLLHLHELGELVHSVLDEKALRYQQAWAANTSVHHAHSVGRLFDAAASLVLNKSETSYEGQAACELEQLYEPYGRAIPMVLSKQDSVYEVDWSRLLLALMQQNLTAAEKSGLFHESLAHCLLQQAILFRQQYGLNQVGMSGGVFQNRVLSELALQKLRAAGFDCAIHSQVPANDASIALGQLIEAMAMEAVVQ